MIISPNSWVFFNTYLFSALLNGSMELVYDIIQPITSVQSINVNTASHSELVKSVFSMFDEIFHQLFNHIIWTKLWALFCTSLIGVLIAFLIIIAIVSYLICALRIIVTYLYSMITLCILFILAPIFISFMLFEKTSKLFRSWINNMISMVFQPVFAFAALAILHKLFIMTLKASFFLLLVLHVSYHLIYLELKYVCRGKMLGGLHYMELIFHLKLLCLLLLI